MGKKEESPPCICLPSGIALTDLDPGDGAQPSVPTKTTSIPGYCTPIAGLVKLVKDSLFCIRSDNGC